MAIYRGIKQASHIQLYGSLYWAFETKDFFSSAKDYFAENFREENIREVNDFESFQKIIKEKGGFVSAHWDGTNETKEAIKKKTKATIRCIPLENTLEEGVCVFSGNPSKQRVLFAKSY